MAGMRILVLGGTRFVSQTIAELALARGHDVTCAARAESAEPPAGARFVSVDRADPAGFDALVGVSFDAVLDTATRPTWVRRALDARGATAGHWTYVSSCSVYADEATVGQTVDAPTRIAAPPGSDETDMEIYGELKVAAETAVLDAVGGRAFVVRPGLIVGPGDRSGRFTYWVERLAAGGDVLAPGTPADLTQVIDVRDLAMWLVDSMESGFVGTLDAISPPIALGALLDDISTGVGGSATLHWVGHTELTELEVEPWMGPRSLPLWLPLPAYAGFGSRDVSASLAAGLAPRPFADTARDTLAWLRATPDAIRTGLTRDEEAEVLSRAG